MAQPTLDEMALEYHRLPKPGKLAVTPTKPLETQRDLSLAYSPGVAAACRAIVDDPLTAADYTVRGNLVGVISNGTAVLGLGNIGPLASKPVMEGKAVLFKKFAGLDVFDIEVAENDPDRLVDIIAALEPTFGGINLEDIKAPECFIVEEKCRQRMKIPVFHDDQHGTAICVGAATVNGLRVVGKKIDEIKIVCAGAGAAALACLNMIVSLGARRENIWVCDLVGLVYEGRTELMDPYKAKYAQPSDKRTLAEVLPGADMFLGLSGPKVLKPEWVAEMAPRPLILALANPEPEILPELVKSVRPDAVMATGRSDYPNQVNNVLCFPFLFRGALDVGATAINEEMKLAAARAIADLTMAEQSDVVARAYGPEMELSFGPDYIIPKPFDPRLITAVAPAVAQAAIDSGVATRPFASLESYRDSLSRFVYRTSFIMRPIFEKARARTMRIAYAEGEDERVLRAAQIVADEHLAIPVLIGRRAVVQRRIERLGLRLRLDTDVTLIDPERDDRYDEFWQAYHGLVGRKGVDRESARHLIRTNATIIAAMAVKLGYVDGMICGAFGRLNRHLTRIVDILGLRPGVARAAAMQAIVRDDYSLFIADSNVNPDPTTDEIVAIAELAIEELRCFGIPPKVAFVAGSNFGDSDHPGARKMREATQRLQSHYPDMEIEGEMKGDAALSEATRARFVSNSRLTGPANLLIFPNLDAANTAVNLTREVTGTISIGPITMGLAASAHVVTPSITTRGLVNMTAVAAAHAQEHADGALGAVDLR